LLLGPVEQGVGSATGVAATSRRDVDGQNFPRRKQSAMRVTNDTLREAGRLKLLGRQY
jgi:hypothetical protein